MHVHGSPSRATTIGVNNGHDFGSNRTEPLSHDLTVYWFQKTFGSVWIGFSINDSASVRFGSKTWVYMFIGLV